MFTMMVGVLIAATLLQIVAIRRWQVRLDRALATLTDRLVESASKPQDGKFTVGRQGTYEPFDFSPPGGRRPVS